MHKAVYSYFQHVFFFFLELELTYFSIHFIHLKTHSVQTGYTYGMLCDLMPLTY